MIQVHVGQPMQVQVLLSAPRQSKRYIAYSVFFFKKQSAIPMLFLSRKRSRSRRLRICKNICNTFGLLLTFFKNDFGCLKTLYEKYMICVCFVTRNLTEKLRTDIAIIISIAALVNVCKK